MDKPHRIEDIKKSILAYVFDKRKKQAVLLDGEWGCGKTFFVEKYLIPELKKYENTKIFKISLYGISSVETIQEMIYAQWLELLVDRITNKLGSIGQLANKGIGIFGTAAVRALENKLSAEGVSDSIASTVFDNDINKSEYSIIIFDDLERCRIDILQLMGFLNNLSENNGFKLILVANEKEIRYKDNIIEEALKYLVVLRNKDNVLLSDNNLTIGRELSKNDLEESAKNIFSEKTLYRKTREKLIGLTVLYNISIGEIFDDIIKEYIDKEDFAEKVIGSKDDIIKIFADNNHKNIRTLICSCIVINDILDAISGNILIENDKLYKDMLYDEINIIIVYSVYSALRRATGKEPFEWTSNTRYAYIRDNLIDKNGIFGYAFIDEYWKTQCVDVEAVVNDITYRIKYRKDIEESNKQNEEHKKLSLYKLINWYLLDDDKVQKLIKDMKI